VGLQGKIGSKREGPGIKGRSLDVERDPYTSFSHERFGGSQGLRNFSLEKEQDLSRGPRKRKTPARRCLGKAARYAWDPDIGVGSKKDCESDPLAAVGTKKDSQGR